MRRRQVAALATAALALTVLPAVPAYAGPPGSPTRVLAIASDGSVRLAWFGPDGGGDITGYRVRASTGAVFTVSEAPVTLTGLRNGVAVSFRVRAVNAAGAGPFSVASATVTPRASTSVNTWTRTDPMRVRRGMATAVRLKNGDVLMLGGHSSGLDASPRRGAELYDPGSATWSTTGSLDQGRDGLTATRLLDGRVLVTGGSSASFQVLRSTRLYDPTTGSWAAAQPMLRRRVGHTATLLPGGGVLVAGGWTGTAATATAEIYDPATDTWSATGSMAVARFGHSATRRLDGNVIVAGGTAGSEGLASAEVYDPASRTWTTTSEMSTPRESDEICCKGAVLLGSGKVLVAGGYHDQVLRTCEVYDPATGTWAPTGSMHVAREAGFNLIRLDDGKVLAVGGIDDFGPLQYAELYDEDTGAWTRINDLRTPRHGAAAVLLRNGTVLVAGGTQGLHAVRSAELFTPAPGGG